MKKMGQNRLFAKPSIIATKEMPLESGRANTYQIFLEKISELRPILKYWSCNARFPYSDATLTGSPEGYSLLTSASFSKPYLGISSFSVNEWGKINPKLKILTATRSQWPIVALGFGSVLAGLASLGCFS
jgi:hypothetical protein